MSQCRQSKNILNTQNGSNQTAGRSWSLPLPLCPSPRAVGGRVRSICIFVCLQAHCDISPRKSIQNNPVYFGFGMELYEFRMFFHFHKTCLYQHHKLFNIGWDVLDQHFCSAWYWLYLVEDWCAPHSALFQGRCFHFHFHCAQSQGFPRFFSCQGRQKAKRGRGSKRATELPMRIPKR